MPRSPMPPITSSPFTLSVNVIVALRVWGRALVPIFQLAGHMIHSVVVPFRASATVSLPSGKGRPSPATHVSPLACPARWDLFPARQSLGGWPLTDQTSA